MPDHVEERKSVSIGFEPFDDQFCEIMIHREVVGGEVLKVNWSPDLG